MSDKKLLPCPICGGEAQFVKLRETYGIPLGYVQCTECGLRLRQENCTEDFARNKWNTRVPLQKIVQRLEEEYKTAQTEYSEAKYLLNEMDTKDREYISQNYRKDMNEGMCFAFDEAIDIVKEEGGMNDKRRQNQRHDG